MTEGRQTTHTRTSTEDGPDFCEECSSDRQEWVRWPCAAGRQPTPLAVLAEVELRPLVVRWRVLRGVVWWQHHRQRLSSVARGTT